MSSDVMGQTGLTASRPRAVARPNGRLTSTLTPISGETDFYQLSLGMAHTAFQSPHWLQNWFRTLADGSIDDAFWVEISDETGERVAAMPLIRHREGSLRVITGADLCVSDYIAPLYGEHGCAGHSSASLWSVLRKSLPPADILRLERLPCHVGPHENEFAHHGLAVPARESGWLVSFPESWDAYYASLSGSVREKLGKSYRRFLRVPDARIAIAQTAEEGLLWLEMLEALQEERIAQKGLDYVLSQPQIASFYRELARTGIESGHVAMAAMIVGDEVIAVNFAVLNGSRATYLRVTNKFGEWAPFSLGLQVTAQLMKDLHARGIRYFDFARGDYDYKRRFGAELLPLVDVTIPLSLKGFPHFLGNQFWRLLGSSPTLRRLTGRTRPGDLCRPVKFIKSAAGGSPGS
jgi:CelD/BcsL family acetyltransferase involved in cellulose biosynthesis